MLEAVSKIERYVNGMSFETFRDDEKTVDAVVRNVGIIGEAANHVPLEFREQYPEIPWDSMRGMRNVVVHDYGAVSLPILWRTATRNLPPLVDQLQEMLEKE